MNSHITLCAQLRNMRRLLVIISILICGAAIAVMSVLRREPGDFQLALTALLPHGFSLLFILILYWCGLRGLVLRAALFTSVALLLTNVVIYLCQAAQISTAERMFAPGVYFLSIILTFATAVVFLLCLAVLKFLLLKRECLVTKSA